MDSIVEIKGLKKSFINRNNSLFKKNKKINVLKGVDLKIKTGEVYGLVGESGCGKTTTGNIITRLLKEDSGDILYKNERINDIKNKRLKNYRKEVQMIFQDSSGSINPKKTIKWILEEPLKIHGIYDKTSNEYLNDRLEDVGLGKEHLKRYPHELSGGQRQRISILSALILNPKLIVADEPVSSLDVSIQAQILNLLKDLQSNYNLTYLFISHDLNVVSYLSDRISVMYMGKIIETGDVENIMKMPAHPYTKVLISSVPKINRKNNRIIIKGDIPKYNSDIGCDFYSRCPYAMDICKKNDPDEINLEKNHTVKCHLFGR
ncbi:ABC transporter ATP-binding protein [Oceanotoga sp. DSM 15011]|uniref:Oligopeptide transport system ATP-binding protein n=1 Tax=Oceanotoga teriensis TaxID=515440 RepID=A0AA45C591_9BACT|nr:MULTISPECIES: ABC transporter ATP-binding protein [Oceanotoga]PWJ88275.1 oligopeptide transport system ATP-binding protein [Oceanotoga teriensis]UYO99274.1 ABC transporter ATP-binding protein [Oceanotoga sp. DSM 15011]